MRRGSVAARLFHATRWMDILQFNKIVNGLNVNLSFSKVIWMVEATQTSTRVSIKGLSLLAITGPSRLSFAFLRKCVSFHFWFATPSVHDVVPQLATRPIMSFGAKVSTRPSSWRPSTPTVLLDWPRLPIFHLRLGTSPKALRRVLPLGLIVEKKTWNGVIPRVSPGRCDRSRQLSGRRDCRWHNCGGWF